MKRIASFEKVSWERFYEDYSRTVPGELTEVQIREIYDSIKLPKRATAYSAGYDFYTTRDIKLESGEMIMVPTGIRVRTDPGWGLFIFPRSGLGTKFRLQLNNTVGVIDGDYYYSDNEGHIFIKIINDSRDGASVSVNTGGAFAQGVFLNYGITYEDDTDTTRNGGFGSTG